MDDKGCRLGRQMRSRAKWPSQAVGKPNLITDTGLEMEMDAQRSLSSSKQRYQEETRIEEINRVRHR